MLLRVVVALLATTCPLYPQAAARLGQSLRELELDPEQCFRVRDLAFQRQDARFYLTDGLLIFSKPVAGEPLAALFSAEVEGGEAELLLMPPVRSERMSLASFTQSPNLEEKFRQALFLFTDGTARDLKREIEAYSGGVKPAPELGHVLRERYQLTMRNLIASFEARIIFDLLTGHDPRRGFFYTAVGGATLGNFDLYVDHRAGERVNLGKVTNGETGTYFDVWCNFIGRDARRNKTPAGVSDVRLSNYRIEATVRPDLRVEAVTRFTARVEDDREGAIGLDISPRMRVREASVDGQPAEVFQRDSLRANLIRGDSNELFLVVPAQKLEKGREYAVEIKHDGEVIREAGNGVYSVAARASWYPQRGLQFTGFEVTFRYPANLTLVSAGDAVDDRTEGDTRITTWRAGSPMRVLGFNLGVFEKRTQSRAGYRVDVYANQKLEAALAPSPSLPQSVPLPVPLWNRQRRPPGLDVPPPPPVPVNLPPSPTARLDKISSELLETLEFFVTRLGPPPLKTLAVTPIPGRFGQGFPGLLYLSTLTYLDDRSQQNAFRDGLAAPYFLETLQSHEIAHQWWGNSVTPATGDDEWIMEALANYSSMLYLEKKRGTKALEQLLSSFRARLLKEGEDGKTLESAGPIVWGQRLTTSKAPAAWQAITYEKGAWIIHMLRRRLGEERFNTMLRELARRYPATAISTEGFRALCEEFLPATAAEKSLQGFFDTWVYGTGIPTLNLTQSVSALTLKGTLTQSNVDEEFSVDVPVEIQLRNGKTMTHWLRSSSEPVEFTLKLPAPALRVSLDPSGAVLRR